MALLHIKCVCLLSQLHLSLVTGSVQKAQVHLYAVCQNRSVGNYSNRTASG